MRLPVIGVATETVVNMHRHDLAQSGSALPRQPRHHVQQHGGVATAAETDDGSQPWSAHGPPAQRLIALTVEHLETGLGALQRRPGCTEQQLVERIRFLRSCS